jgi:hypothetical protein
MLNATSSDNCGNLPHDISSILDAAAKTWLTRYGLYPDELSKFWWSDSSQQLIYPVFDVAGQLVFWQARNFGGYPNQKYFTSGNIRNHLHILGTTGPLILVEDSVSAIKVARSCWQSMPLFGSHVTRDLLIRLKNHGLASQGRNSQLGIWLDPDKFEDGMKYTNLARELGISAFMVSSLSDPKYYANFEINNFINLGMNP